MPIRKAEAKSAADAASSGDVIEELRRRYDRLTQSQKRIAEYIVEHSQAVAFSTVDQMAEQILRTCYSFVIYSRDFSSAICDPDGNSTTVGAIRKGLLDGFFGRKTPEAWRLNPTVPAPADAMRTTSSSKDRRRRRIPFGCQIHRP
jgi:hypothetical protein